MSGNSAGLSRPDWPAVPGEPHEVFRLQQFRAAHPGVIVGKGEFDTWQARIPHPTGETVTIRHTLRELLDRLAELLAEDNGPPVVTPAEPSAMQPRHPGR